jgi:DNA-binding MarR family transcriptional regulator
MAVPKNGSSKSNGDQARLDKAIIVDSIRAIARGLRTTGRQTDEPGGVTGAQIDVLRALQGKPASSINDLASRTFTHQSSVSMVVGRLVQDGLVMRTSSAQDGRRVALSLTSEGRALLKRSPDSSEERLLAALRSMNHAELSDLAGCLEKLSAKIDGRSNGSRANGKLNGSAKTNGTKP